MIETIESILGLGMVILLLLGFVGMFFPSNEDEDRYTGAGTIPENDTSPRD